MDSAPSNEIPEPKVKTNSSDPKVKTNISNPKAKTNRSEPSGECTITSRTVDDWLDPCTSCYGVIKTDKLESGIIKSDNQETKMCDHSYHAHCHLRLFTKVEYCPLCLNLKLKSGVRSAFKCPFCNELSRRDEWLEHCKKKHRAVRCKRCKDLYLLHNKDAHSKTLCKDPATIPIGCPALYCTAQVSKEVFEKGITDPSVLIVNHKCKEVHTCDGCGTGFLDMKKYEIHIANAFVCEWCSKCFQDIKKYERHVTKSTVCKGCSKCFQDKKRYDEHIEKSFICEACGRCFQHQKQYEKHITFQASNPSHGKERSPIKPRIKRRRAASDDSARLNSKVRILAKNGIFKKLSEDPRIMSRRRLMQIVAEHKHLFGKKSGEI